MWCTISCVLGWSTSTGCCGRRIFGTVFVRVGRVVGVPVSVTVTWDMYTCTCIRRVLVSCAPVVVTVAVVVMTVVFRVGDFLVPLFYLFVCLLEWGFPPSVRVFGIFIIIL